MSGNIEFEGGGYDPNQLEKDLQAVFKAKDVKVEKKEQKEVKKQLPIQPMPNSEIKETDVQHIDTYQISGGVPGVREQEIQLAFDERVASTALQPLKFKARVLVEEKTQTRQELLYRLSQEIQHLSVGLRDKQKSREELQQIRERHITAMRLRDYVKKSKQIDSTTRKAGKVALKIFIGLFKSPFTLIKYGKRALSGLDTKLLAIDRKRKIEYSPKAIKAAQKIREIIKGKSTASLQETFENPYLNDKDRQDIQKLLSRKNSALRIFLNYLGNKLRALFKGSPEGIDSNIFFKKALDNRTLSLSDLFFIIDHKLFSHVSPGILRKIDKLLLPEEEKRKILERLFHTSDDFSSQLCIVDYLRKSGNTQDVALAKTLVQGLWKQDATEEQKNAARRLTAMLGDEALIKTVFGIDCSAITLDSINTIELTQEQLPIDKNGQTLLHYAMQSKNSKFAALIAEKIKKEGVNPFLIEDKKGNKPIYTMTRSLAEQLDSFYGLDANRRGSFSGAAYCFKRIRQQAVRWGNIGNIKWFNKILSTIGSVVTGMQMPVDLGYDTDFAAKQAADYAGDTIGERITRWLEKIVRKVLLRRRGSKLTLQQYDIIITHKETTEKIKQAKLEEKRAKEKDESLKTRFSNVLKRRDVVGLKEMLDEDKLEGSQSSLNTSSSYKIAMNKEMIKKLWKFRSFKIGNIDYREELLNSVVDRTQNADLVEKLMDSQMKGNGRSWVESRFQALMDSKTMSSSERQALIIMAVKYGRIDVLKKMSDKENNLLNIQNRKGDTLLHLAARAQNINMLLYVAEKIAEQMQQQQKDGVVKYQVDRSKGPRSLARLFLGRYVNRQLENNPFNITNAKGQKIQDLISYRFAAKLDDTLGLDSSEPASFFHLVRLREREVDWEQRMDEEFGDSIKIAMSIASDHSTSMAVKATAVAVTAHAGPIVGVIVAIATKFVISVLMGLTVGVVVKLLMKKKTGEMLSTLETVQRGYATDVSQAGKTIEDAQNRLRNAITLLESKERQQQIANIFISCIHATMDNQAVQEAFREEKDKLERLKEILISECEHTDDLDQMMNHLIRRLQNSDIQLTHAQTDAFRRSLIETFSMQHVQPLIPHDLILRG